MFLVRWKGYDSGSDSWVARRDLHCTGLIAQFYEKVSWDDTCFEWIPLNSPSIISLSAPRQVTPHKSAERKRTLSLCERDRRKHPKHRCDSSKSMNSPTMIRKLSTRIKNGKWRKSSTFGIIVTKSEIFSYAGKVSRRNPIHGNRKKISTARSWSKSSRLNWRTFPVQRSKNYDRFVNKQSVTQSWMWLKVAGCQSGWMDANGKLILRELSLFWRRNFCLIWHVNFRALYYDCEE